jgi:lipopolysaccharide/colanic/teichoic acid biosynthesis glycosyltransferase
VKRLFDIIGSFLGLILLSPVLLAVAVLLKIKMPGPVLFIQSRSGRYGRPFRIFKFRTMVLDHKGSTISVKGETRITPLGSMLRKYKLDELPELWNVLLGDMSFVGPRPDMPEYTNRLEGEEKLILELRPGITGPASLKYANEEEILATVSDPLKYNDEIIWPDKVRINLNYYHEKSIAGDLRLILKTLRRMLG